MPVTISAPGSYPIDDFDGAPSGPLSGTQTALAGVAVNSIAGPRPALITANLNIHGPTGSLVTVQILESVSSTVLGQAQVTLGGNGASDDYRTIALQTGILLQASTSYGFEITASVTGGSASVVGGGISISSGLGR
jgi:hypothetical protein